ncbi:hypothetical protein [Dyadobacter sp. LHD-138]|uniref:hypothetical protein n=1 Tax=Dyadobacter sp. LHD-138 TaxID=3071413 RepID=UPI0027E019DD|nr:hypothetical protein [Dyadobacter sp. LHD-138]MDQ6480538.1 hypothetical protein [Dyadobacter sp. LHD-138]
MKINRQSLFAFIISALVLSSCSKKSSNIDPITLEERQNIVLVPTDKLTALDGNTGMVKWEMPFLGEVSAGTAGKLYLNQTAYGRIGMYSDTVVLYNNPSKAKNLISVEPSTGKVIQQVYNQLKPGFYLGCCHELQINQLIGVDNGTAFMALMFRGPFSNGWPTTQRFAIYATDLTTGSVKWATDIATSEIPAFDNV